MKFNPEFIFPTGALFHYSNSLVQKAGGTLSWSEFLLQISGPTVLGLFGVAISQLASRQLGYQPIDDVTAFSIPVILSSLFIEENGHRWVVGSGLFLGGVLGFTLPYVGIDNMSELLSLVKGSIDYWKNTINSLKGFRMPNIDEVEPLIK